jgi:hypothetical protein
MTRVEQPLRDGAAHHAEADEAHGRHQSSCSSSRSTRWTCRLISSRARLGFSAAIDCVAENWPQQLAETLGGDTA